MLVGESNSNSNQPIRLYKLSVNGTVDSVYTQEGSYYSSIKSITLDEGKVYLSGSFTSVEATGRNRFVRLLDPDITLGVNDSPSDISQMMIYPNPTNDILNINVSDGLTIYKVEVYNNLGQLVISKKDLTENKILDVSNLRSGIYYLKMNADGKQITRKFIKE